MMSGEQKNIYVYDDFSFDKPLMLGTLYVSVIKGGETYSCGEGTAQTAKTL